MPPENTKALSDDYRKQLDSFIEGNYKKLLHYAVYSMNRDKDAGAELLNDVIVKLYTGQRRLDFNRTPLTYMQYIMSSIRFGNNVNRQRAFENGLKFEFNKEETKKTKQPRKVKATIIRDTNYDVAVRAYEVDTETSLFEVESNHLYRRWKREQTPYEQWILDKLEEGLSIEQIYALRHNRIAVKGTRQSSSLETLRVYVCRLISRVRVEMKALLQAS